MHLRLGLGLCLLLSACGAAGATTITFAGIPLSGNLTTYTEGGYTVTNTSGQFRYSTFGNPSLSIYTQNTSSATVTDGGALFDFTSLELVNDQSTASYVITGYNGLTQLFTTGGTLPTYPPGSGSGNFRTYGTGFSSLAITSLQITLSGSSIDANVDDIVVSGAPAVTPEPSSFVLLGTGLLGIAASIRRRIA